MVVVPSLNELNLPVIRPAHVRQHHGAVVGCVINGERHHLALRAIRSFHRECSARPKQLVVARTARIERAAIATAASGISISYSVVKNSEEWNVARSSGAIARGLLHANVITSTDRHFGNKTTRP
jgi:hypothetical protein